MQKTIDGVRIGYDAAGSGDAIVLLHGFPLDRTIWDAQFAALAERGRVVRLDFRGSGESSAGDGPALMETLAGDAFGLLEALGIERAIVVGHSMGGYAALAFFRMYAERVAGLALVASHTGADSAQRASAREELIAAIAARGMRAVTGTMFAGERDAPADPALRAQLRDIVLRQDPAGAIAQAIGIKERVDSADLLEDIVVPVALVGGGADGLIAPEILEATAARLSDCELTLIPATGHYPMLEAPQQTTAALERLVARCAAHRGAGAHSS